MSYAPVEVSPQATFEDDLILPITFPSNLILPAVLRLPFNLLPSPIILFVPFELSTF